MSEPLVSFVVHLLFGFAFFLRRNLAELSWDFSTCGGGLLALALATFLIHRFFTRVAAKARRYWSFRSTVALMMLLPVFFGMAFLVPGILLQWELFR